jgi:hypothetical protein
MRGVEWIFEMDSMLMLGMREMLMERLSYAKEDLMGTMATISPRQRPRSSRIYPLLGRRKTSASATASVNLGKIMV